MTAREHFSFFVTAPPGLADLLADEIRSLGIDPVLPARAGAGFRGGIEDGYRVCLWSRTASRVLLTLAQVSATGSDELYQGAYEVPWEDHVPPDGSLAVDVDGAGTAIHHTRFALLRVKDAIVDRLRALAGRRPSVDTARPDVRVHVHLEGDRATLSIDLSGDPLHRRGYRLAGVEAPLKENLAAGILLRAGWPAVAAAGGGFVDPMSGSGTFPIEAALMAGDVAPGLRREYWGFLGWHGHRPGTWARLVEDARTRAATGLARLPPILGYDEDPQAVQAAQANARRAGLDDLVRFEVRPLRNLVPPEGLTARPGLLVTNPPYGHRLGEQEGLSALYRLLGERLQTAFADWQAAVLTGSEDLARAIGLRVRRRHVLWNGPIECRLLRFRLAPPASASSRPGPEVSIPTPPALSAGAEMFANRLRKNLLSLGRWARRAGVTCYRLYDADMPEYAVAIDLYEGERREVHVQEYAPPATVDATAAARRLREVRALLPALLGVPRDGMHLKVRARQRGSAQYTRMGDRGRPFAVQEGECRFLVNLTDYLDTGLFLDHRDTRRLIAGLAGGKRFLNLFAYTATATVCAARGGARSTTSVDLSQTYLDWARRNLALNGFDGAEHGLVRADCVAWLAEQTRTGARYDLIFVDPPTFSNSKRMAGVFDVQRDHVPLIRAAADLLTAAGTLLFSTNLRSFRMDRDALADLAPEDITRQTIPRDFERNPRIHQCWRITR